jgi:hypothetical protein
MEKSIYGIRKKQFCYGFVELKNMDFLITGADSHLVFYFPLPILIQEVVPNPLIIILSTIYIRDSVIK